MEILTYKPYTEKNCICEYPNCSNTEEWCGKLAVWKGRDHVGPDSRPCYVCNEHYELLVVQGATSAVGQVKSYPLRRSTARVNLILQETGELRGGRSGRVYTVFPDGTVLQKALLTDKDKKELSLTTPSPTAFIPSSLSEYLAQIEEESSALDSYPS